MHPAASEKSVLLIGGSGFIGSSLGEHLASQGYTLRLLSRKKPQQLQLSFPCKVYEWDGKALPLAALAGVATVINLAGQGIADERWSAAYRDKILHSRLEPTRALVAALTGSSHKPTLIIQASAVGYYGSEARAGACDEHSAAGSDFVAQVCQAWEKAAAPLAGMSRFCLVRFGVVLGWKGGAWPKLWKLYRCGLGGVLGRGDQWMNWVHSDDVLRFIDAALVDPDYQGVYNMVAPHNCDNLQFHKTLCQYTPSLGWVHIPSPLLQATLGQRSILLREGPRVRPSRLLAQGFTFRHPDLDAATKALVKQLSNLS